MKKLLTILLVFVPLLAQRALAQSLLPNEKNRVIVTTDLGGTDPDDIQSMVHLLVCSNVYDIEGLVSSQVWMTDPDKTGKIKEVVERFGEILPRLKNTPQAIPIWIICVPLSSGGRPFPIWTEWEKEKTLLALN